MRGAEDIRPRGAFDFDRSHDHKLTIPPDEVYGAHDPVVAMYCDGGCMVRNPSPYGGAWAWCHVNAKGIALREASGLLLTVPMWPTVSNNYAEYVACLRGLEALPDDWVGHVYTDSRITIGRFVEGWATYAVPDVLVRRAHICMARLGGTFWHLLDGHPTNAQLKAGSGKGGNPVSRHNVWADGECTRLMSAHMAGLRAIEVAIKAEGTANDNG